MTKTKETFWLGSTQCYYNSIVLSQAKMKMKWNESGFRPPLCTYRLNRARRTSWGWWDDWDDTALQIQDSKFEPWRSEAEHATSRSRRLPTILTFTRGWGRNIFCFFQTAETGNRTPNSGVKGSGARAPAQKCLLCLFYYRLLDATLELDSLYHSTHQPLQRGDQHYTILRYTVLGKGCHRLVR